MTLLLFLSRLMVLKYCLSVQGCRETFSSARWALLQVCPNMFEDVFEELFTKLSNKINGRILLGSELTSIVKQEFMSVHKMLADLKYPNFSSESPFRLVIDEAQILGNMNPESFVSLFLEGEKRPMLSPVLHGFRTPGNKDKLTIIYCGTGLSIKTLRWVKGSGDDVKSFDPTKDLSISSFQDGRMSIQYKRMSNVSRIHYQMRSQKRLWKTVSL
ncbi:hypothetical protein BDF22DRAFT_183704 [Syncephalis plumigaleata]|nr:hypothetical protein BDF22DRAFT_183704 [Syncephalis plumigaleata]